MSPAKCFKSVITHIQFKKAAEFPRRHLALRPTCTFPETRKLSPSGNTETCKHLPTIVLRPDSSWFGLICTTSQIIFNGPWGIWSRQEVGLLSRSTTPNATHKLQVVLPFPILYISTRRAVHPQNTDAKTGRNSKGKHKLSPTESPNPHCSKKNSASNPKPLRDVALEIWFSWSWSLFQCTQLTSKITTTKPRSFKS